MKIKREHYELLRDCMMAARKVNTVDQALTEMEISGHYSDMRIRWDWFHATKIDGQHSDQWGCKNLYSYLNDDHSDTALKSITGLRG